MNHWIAGIVSFIHVISAAVAIGGTFFFRLMLLRLAKAQGGLDPALREALAARWTRVLWHMTFALAVTGMISFGNALAGHKYGPLQHGLFGAKFLVFLGIVSVLSLLTWNPDWVKSRRPQLMLLNVVLGAAIILLSTLLRRSY